MTDQAVDDIDRNARMQARLIEDILDVSRIITGKLRLEPIAGTRSCAGGRLRRLSVEAG